MKEEELSCDDLIKTLERNVAILRIENHYNVRISNELETKLAWFNNVSCGLADKLSSLWSLAEARNQKGNEIKQFTNQIATSWAVISRQIYEKYSKIKMASRTLQGVPLSLLLDKMKKEVVLLKVSLQVHESTYNHEYLLKGFKLITKIEQLVVSLEKCDDKLQQYLSISNITPHLVKLDTMVDKYASSAELLPMKKSFISDLSIFSLVTKLLTGELLGHESIDPNHILLENIPKKPVFIIKNVKRKTICPSYPT